MRRQGRYRRGSDRVKLEFSKLREVSKYSVVERAQKAGDDHDPQSDGKGITNGTPLITKPITKPAR